MSSNPARQHRHTTSGPLDARPLVDADATSLSALSPPHPVILEGRKPSLAQPEKRGNFFNRVNGKKPPSPCRVRVADLPRAGP